MELRVQMRSLVLERAQAAGLPVIRVPMTKPMARRRVIRASHRGEWGRAWVRR